MTGLEKVTGKIIADAEADARATMARAEAECQAVREKYKKQADAEDARLREAAERECAALITRGKSSAAIAKRNVILETRSRLLDEAYQRAEKEIRNLPAEQYKQLLAGMLKGALRRQLEDEKENLRLYGEDVSPEAYEILLNSRDRKNFGQYLLDEVQNGLATKAGLSDFRRVRLASDTADISGGLILRCGDVESNCSLSMMFSEVRQRTKGKVADILFGKRA